MAHCEIAKTESIVFFILNILWRSKSLTVCAVVAEVVSESAAVAAVVSQCSE